MPSSSIYRANKINQQINDYLFSMFPIRWCTNNNSWSAGSKGSWRKFTFIILWKTCLATILLLVALHLVLNHYSTLFEFHYALILVTFLNFISGSVVSDIVCYLFGKDVVICCNFCYSKEDNVSTSMFAKQNSNLWFRVLKQDTKIQTTKKDPVGELMIHFIIFFTLGPTLVLLVLISMNMDPFYFYVVLARQIEFGFQNNLIFLMFLHVCRFLAAFFFWQWVMVSIKTAVLITFTMVASLLKVFQVLKTLKLNYITIRTYKEMTIERNFLIGFEKFFSGIGLTGLYWFTVVSLNGVVLAIKLRNSQLFIVMFTMSALGFLIITFIFVFCCSIYEDTVAILQQWNIQVASCRNRFLLRRIIRSCRPLPVPAGNVGILDKEIKMNYFHSVVVNTINLMLVINDFMPINKSLR